MAASPSVAEMKKIIADLEEALEATQTASAKTEEAALVLLNANEAIASARAHGLLTSTPTTPSAVVDDDEWIWTPWYTEKHGPSSLPRPHGQRPDGAVKEHEDLGCHSSACANTAHAKGNAGAAGHSDTRDDHSDLSRPPPPSALLSSCRVQGLGASSACSGGGSCRAAGVSGSERVCTSVRGSGSARVSGPPRVAPLGGVKS